MNPKTIETVDKSGTMRLLWFARYPRFLCWCDNIKTAPPIVIITAIMMRIRLVDALFKASASVGPSVGEELGPLVGLDVGLLAGPPVGFGVGAIIGDVVLGLRVGLNVRVGAGTGANDGFRVAATAVMLEVSTVTVVLNALLTLL